MGHISNKASIMNYSDRVSTSPKQFLNKYQHVPFKNKVPSWAYILGNKHEIASEPVPSDLTLCFPYARKFKPLSLL